jgi:hypothetical protein
MHITNNKEKRKGVRPSQRSTGSGKGPGDP